MLIYNFMTGLAGLRCGVPGQAELFGKQKY